MHAATDITEASTVDEGHYDETMHNFSHAYTSTQAAINNLTQVNQNLQSETNSHIQQILNQVNNLCQYAMAGSSARPPPPVQQMHGPPQQYYQQPPPQYQQQQPPPYNAPPPPQSYQPPQQQRPNYQQRGAYNNNGGYNNNYRPQGRGGGGRGGGRGGGGGRGYGNNNNYGQQQQQQQGGQQGQGFYANNRRNAPHSNPTKRHANWNYCWTHGFDVEDYHDSSNCTEPKQGHVWQATRNNICDGCRKNEHKNVFPQPRANRGYQNSGGRYQNNSQGNGYM